MNKATYNDLVKRHFWFQKEELKSILIVSIIFAFIVSFTQWSEDINEVLRNYWLAFVIVLISIFVHHAAQRLAALKEGFVAQHKLWWYGSLWSLLITFLSNGKFQVFFGSGVELSVLEKHRVGKGKPGSSHVWEIAKICSWGIIANLCLAASVKSIDLYFYPLPSIFVNQLYFFNLLYSFYNFFPIPPLDGSKILFANRMLYVFLFSFFLAYLVLIYLLEYYSFIWALIIAVVMWILFYVFWESERV